MCLFMNVFYCLKRSRGNEPVSFETLTTYEDIQQLIAKEKHMDDVPLRGRPRIEAV
jgi:hypothetical protein